MKNLFTSLTLLLGLFLGAAPAARAQQELVFDRTQADQVSVPLAVPATGALTLEAWVYYAGATYNGSYNTVLEFSNDAPYFGVTNTGALTLYQSVTAGSVPVQTWAHVAYVWDGTTSSIYINGVQVGSSNTAPAPRTGSTLGIGYNIGDTGWDGAIDEVMVWNAARTTAQLQADAMLRQVQSNTLPGSPAGLLAYFKFNEGSGQTTANLAASGPAGTLGFTNSVELNDPTWAPSITTNNNALAFDGANDQVNVPSSPSLTNIPTAVTAEAWFRTSVTGERYIMTKGDDSFYLAMQGGGGLAGVVSWYVNGPSGPSGGWLYGSTNLADNRWHHVAGTYDGASLRLYVDGVLENARAATGSIQSGGSHSLDIGARTGSSFWNGSLEDVRVYNTALTLAQVQADRFSATPVAAANVVASYDFNQGMAGGNNAGVTALADASGNSNTGTLNGFALTGTTSNWVRSFPTITNISPSSGGVGTSVSVTGTNLLDVTGFGFNGTAVTPFTAPTNDFATTITVPSGASTGPVSLASALLTRYAGPVFTYLGGDLVVSTTMTIPPATYNNVTVTGTGVGTLGGDVVVNGALVVQSGGVLSDGCNIITGPGTFTLSAGGTLSICRARGILAVGDPQGNIGLVRVTGGRSFSPDASYIYAGSDATGSGLPSQVRNLSITVPGDVALSAPTSVAQTLTLSSSGNLVTGGNALTLLSSASGTALVVNSGTGTVNGTATVQRYIDPSLNPGPGYRHYAAPVSNSSVADLATAGFTPEISQAAAYNASPTPSLVTPFPTVFAYDQSRVTLTNSYTPFDRGFVVPGSTTVPLTVGRGYAVNLPGTALVDFVGTLNNGLQTLTLTRNATGTANAGIAGWQLVGNPYPSPLDFSQIAPADLTGLDPAMYVFESSSQYAGSYRAYVNGVGSSSLIGTAQGFFMRVSTGQTTGTLNFRNSQRVTSYATQVPFRRNTTDVRPLVKLDLRGSTGTTDAFYAYAETGATSAYDTQYDAVKLPNSTGLNLASVSAGTGEALAIDGRPVFTTATAIDLTVGVPAAGTYALGAAELANLPTGLTAYLRDAVTGTVMPLSAGSSYSFSVSAAEAQAPIVGRFTLQFNNRNALATASGLNPSDVQVFPNPARESFTAAMPAVAGATSVRAELLNTLGQVVHQQSAALTATGGRLAVPTATLAPGVYVLRLKAGASTVTKRVVIQ